MCKAGILAVTLFVLGTAAPASGQQGTSSGAGATQRPFIGTVRDAKDERTRRCQEDRNSLQRKRVEVEQKQRRDHEAWHRSNDRLRGGEWLRKHQSFHQRLQREREQFDRVHAKDCNEETGRRGGGDRDDDRWRKEHDTLERERDRFREKLERSRN